MNISNHPLLSTLFFISFLSACDRTAPDMPAATLDEITVPLLLPAQVNESLQNRSMLFDGISVHFQNETDPNQTMVVLPDAGAEKANTSGPIMQSALPAGMAVTGDCAYSNTDIAASHGNWKFELEPGCSILQMSDDTLETDEAISLVFSVNRAIDTSAQLQAEILGIHSNGAETVLTSSRLDMPVDAAHWITKQISVDFGAVNQNVGEKIAVRFTNISSTASAIYLDSISLSLYVETTDQNLVFNDSWNGQCDQLWAGEHFWSNRLQDWQIANERLETKNPSKWRPKRTTHRITTEMTSAPADFSLSVDTGAINDSSVGSYSGILIGAGGRMDYRSAALVHNRHGQNGGLIAGIDHEGNTFILDNATNEQLRNDNSNQPDPPKNGARNKQLDVINSLVGSTLQLDAKTLDNGQYRLNLFATDRDGNVISKISVNVESAQLLGNIAIVSNPGQGDTAHWFDNWKGAGSKLRERASREFGPVLFASYTVDRGVLTVNAQYPPLCAENLPSPTLEVFQQGEWTEVGRADIDVQSYTARFSISSWEYTENTHYRIITPSASEDLQHSYFEGVIKFIPPLQDELVIGLYNCRPGIINSKKEGWIQQNNNAPFSWTRDRIVFPHEELIENSQKHNPDLVAFLGDQIYEFDPNGLVEKELPNITYDYLWKWYQFGWSVRELMRNTPSFVLPDDHDVFQANVWGQGGGIAPTEESGGYVYPAEFINIVQRTQTGSLPSPFDPTPVDQNISVYYTDLVMGGVGLAILEDRKFKTGPHANQDDPQLLGNRQLAFIEQWAADWEGQSMKIALSQSPFSLSSTHSGGEFNLILQDQDSNGWPKPGRDRAVEHLRKAFAPHLSGDQHLGLSLKHGVDEYDDAIYSFAAPSMLNIFPRVWDPLNESDGRGDRDVSPLGPYTDQHNNLLTVLAVANPNVYYQTSDPVDTPSKNDLGIGYGIVRVNTQSRQYSFEAWPANIDPLEPAANPYSNWPITFNQIDNDGRVPEGFLMPRVAAVDEPIVQVFKESNDELEYARRYSNATVNLPIYDRSVSYRVVLSNPATGYSEEFINQRAQ